MTFPNMVIGKKNVYIFIFKSKEANVMTYSHRHTSGTCLPNCIDFGLKMGMLCMLSGMKNENIGHLYPLGT